MGLYIRLFTNFWTHRKTAHLRSMIGEDAYWLPPRLWSYAAENQPDGDFSSYTASMLALLLGYNKDASSMLQALQQAGFMDEMKIHNWEEHNNFHHAYSKKAKNAADARWEKERTKEKEEKGKEKSKHCLSNAPSIIESKFMASIGALYKRRESTHWDGNELKKLREVIKRPDCELELGEIEKLYGSGYKYRRQNIITLLNNWPGEVDRARGSVQVNGKPRKDCY